MPPSSLLTWQETCSGCSSWHPGVYEAGLGAVYGAGLEGVYEVEHAVAEHVGCVFYAQHLGTWCLYPGIYSLC